MNSLNHAGDANASARISAGDYNTTSGWSFSAEDGNALLGSAGDDWANYGKWHLGIDAAEAQKTKARYKYPFGKGGKVYQSALDAIRSRASGQNDTGIFDAAGRHLDAIKAKDGKAAAPISRAYGIFTIKSIMEDQRIIEGMASTPTPDRMGDVVEPMGAKFALPMPLLWQHDSSQPIGHVEYAKAMADGIPFRARIVQIAEPGALKNRVDEAWQTIKTGLVRGVSIGFRALEYAFMENGGIHFQSWEWMELSAVTIPANAGATIQTIKSFDREILAAPGKKNPVVYLTDPPGASGHLNAKQILKICYPGQGGQRP